MIKKFLFLICLLFAAFPVLIFAEEDPVQNQIPGGLRKDINKINRDASVEVRDTRKDAREDVKGIRREAQSNIKDVLQQGIKSIKAIRATTTQAIKANLQEMMNKIKTATTTEGRRELRIELRGDFKEDRMQKREEMKTAIAEEGEALKEKLKVIKDQRKKEVVERIADRVNSINEIRTDRFLKLLEKFEDFLDRISAQADALEKEGKDITGVRTAVAEAESAINASRAAVEAQAEKIYEIIITTEGNLGNSVSAAIRARQDDLKTVEETVKKAHETVRKALITLKSIK